MVIESHFLKLPLKQYACCIAFISIVVCSCTNMGDYSVELSGGYKVVQKGRNIKRIFNYDGKKNTIIDAVKYSYNDNYILAIEATVKHYGTLQDGLPYIDTAYSYWIISHNDLAVLGPMTKQEYYTERNKLRLPISLTLE